MKQDWPWGSTDNNSNGVIGTWVLYTILSIFVRV